MTPDDFVDAYGEPVTITRAVSLTVTMDGAEDVEREVEQTKGIIRSPPTESMLQRLEGRIDEGSIQVTLPSSSDVSVRRQGGRDRLALGHVDPASDTGVDAYSIVEIFDDTHPITGTRKLTVVCQALNRPDLQDDAVEYWATWSDDILVVESGEIYTIEEGDTHSYAGVDNDGTIDNDGTLEIRT